MKSLFAALAIPFLAAVPARAQDSGNAAASGSYGQDKQHKTNGSSQAEVGERAPGDAASSTSTEGRPRAGIEVGTASAMQGGRTDNGTPPARKAGQAAASDNQTSTANNSANRGAHEGETEDKEFNRVPGQDATMMTKDQQKKEAASARKRGAARKDTSLRRSKGADVPNPEGEKPATKNRKE
jgi:hypothetical protein